MKTYTKYSMILFSVLLVNVNLFSQDVQFSQFYTAKFNIAPSFAGTAENGRLTLLFRDQWPMLKNTFLTYAFAVDYAMSSLHGGLGFYAMQDYSNGGAYVITNSGIQYSYAIELNPVWQFRPGLQISAINQKIDLDKITFGSQLSFDGTNNNYPVNIESGSITNMEAAVSALFYSDRYWMGMNVDHLPLTRNSFTGENPAIPVKFITFGGVLLKKIQGRLFYDKTYIYLSYLFKYQNDFKQLDLGVYWSKKGWELGIWYRGLPLIKNSYGKFNNSALIFKGGLEIKNYRFGYSYDYSLSTTGIRTGGAHEVSMVCLFDLTDELKKKKHKMVPSPRF
ncbi:MAG: PorP/SprF family type IX secretion system membrane protein [Bacteroidales bacterium]|nr:PorP/SprF family type IX secretion system membrane protein [Bacteroidales bacterium]